MLGWALQLQSLPLACMFCTALICARFATVNVGTGCVHPSVLVRFALALLQVQATMSTATKRVTELSKRREELQQHVRVLEGRVEVWQGRPALNVSLTSCHLHKWRWC